MGSATVGPIFLLRFSRKYEIFILSLLKLRDMIYKFNKQTLRPHSVLRQIIVSTSIIVLIASGIGFYYGFQNGRNVLQNLSPEEKLIILNDYDKFTPEKFKTYMEELNIPHTDIVYAQAVLETGGFTSHIFRMNNNLFGMKVATIRPTTNIGEEDGHAAFKHWRHSVVDYALYASCYLTKMNREEYLNYLSARYAEDPNYIVKVKQIIEKEKNK